MWWYGGSVSWRRAWGQQNVFLVRKKIADEEPPASNDWKWAIEDASSRASAIISDIAAVVSWESRASWDRCDRFLMGEEKNTPGGGRDQKSYIQPTGDALLQTERKSLVLIAHSVVHEGLQRQLEATFFSPGRRAAGRR